VAERALRELVNGFRASQAIHAAVVLGVPDELARGARSTDELAESTGANADALYRLLRALASVGVLHEEDDRRFTLTETGEILRSDVPGSLAGWAAYVGRPSSWNSWGALLHSVRTGENAFRHVHGETIWEWRAARPEEQAVFDGAMAAQTGAVITDLLGAYDFDRFGTIVDVGGGNGTLLAAILERHPGTRGILFDQPHVVEAAAAVLAPVADRARRIGGSFFESVPEGGDAYVLKWIIHDWEDAESIQILTACREAMGTDATLLMIERDLGPPNAESEAKFSDLNMLVNPGGRERSWDEYAQLFQQAGLRLENSTPAGMLAVYQGRSV
jgi:hypothetical protein